MVAAHPPLPNNSQNIYSDGTRGVARDYTQAVEVSRGVACSWHITDRQPPTLPLSTTARPLPLATPRRRSA